MVVAVVVLVNKRDRTEVGCRAAPAPTTGAGAAVAAATAPSEADLRVCRREAEAAVALMYLWRSPPGPVAAVWGMGSRPRAPCCACASAWQRSRPSRPGGVKLAGVMAAWQASHFAQLLLGLVWVGLVCVVRVVRVRVEMWVDHHHTDG